MKLQETHRKPFRRDIQALRALAVISVVLFHLWPSRLIGGFTGVDIFLVISGYLMTISIMRRLKPIADKQDITIHSVARLLTDFYAHRIRRLVPAALSTLITVLLLSWLTGNLNVMLTNAKNVISAATFWQNWFLANDSLNYLQQDNLVVATQHFWSLSLEEQFYLAWPLLLVISTLLTTSLVLLYKKKRITGVVLPIIFLTMLSIAYGAWLTKSQPTIAYYSTPARVWELMIGGIIALLPTIKNYDLKLLLPYLGLAIELYSIFFISGNNFPGWWALVPTIGTALIIWSGTDRAASPYAFDRLFGSRPIQWTGNISYSIYLWHYPLIVLLPILLHQSLDGTHGRTIKLGIILLSFIIAHLSYIYIEQTTQHIRIKTVYTYIIFVVATALVVMAGLGLKLYSEHQASIGLKQMHSAALSNSDCFGARAIQYSNKCGDAYGATEKNYIAVGTQDDFRQIIESGKICTKFSRQANPKEHWHDYKKVCVIGDTSATKTISVIGDSHADQYINAFDVLGRKHHIKVYIYDIVSCNPWSTTTSNPNCKKRLDYIEHSTTIKTSNLILVSLFYHDYNFASHFISFVNTKFKSNKVVLIKDNAVTHEQNLNNCYNAMLQCKSPASVALKDTNMITQRLIDNGVILKKNVVDTDKFFCDSNYCYSNIGGVPIYYQTTDYSSSTNSHITASYSYSLGDLMYSKLHPYLSN